MNSDNNNIDLFFREALQNYEFDSSDLLWDRIDTKLSEIQNADISQNKNIKQKNFIKNTRHLYVYTAIAATIAFLIIVAGKFFNQKNINPTLNITTNKPTANHNTAIKNKDYLFTYPNNNNIYIYHYFIHPKLPENYAILNYENLTALNKLQTEYLINNINKDNLYINNKKSTTKNDHQSKDNNVLIVNDKIDTFINRNINRNEQLAYSYNNDNYLNGFASTSQMQQQYNATNYKINDINTIKDTVSISKTAKNNKNINADKSQLTNTELLMKETYGIDTSDKREIQELKLNEQKPTQTLVFPNVFTPNNDGMNDCFVILGIDECSYNSLIITDRYGKTVYETVNYQNDWMAHNIPDGVYYFIFTCNCNGKNYIKKGMLTILR